MVSTEPNFESFFNLELTQAPPNDWWVMSVDIQGSSAAISEGKGREVNLVGAASVAAIRNQFGALSVPYVFGGDGACFLVSPSHLTQVEKTLRSVQKLVRERLNFHLRVGKVSLEDIRENGGNLRYGFLAMGTREGFHFFRGNGLALAEKQLKLSSKDIPSDALQIWDVPNLSGLSCKLDPFQKTRENVLSVIIEPSVPLEEEDKLFKEIIKTFCGDKKLGDFKPISVQNHGRSWIPKSWKAEASLLAHSVFKAFSENLFITFLFRTNFKLPSLGSPSNYTKALLRQSDWIKMDGSLRMVVETSYEEGQRLEESLQRLFELGKLYYGIARSNETVMTCHLQSARDDRHTHFIDGGQGGLTRAALDLKKQKSTSIAPKM